MKHHLDTAHGLPDRGFVVERADDFAKTIALPAGCSRIEAAHLMVGGKKPRYHRAADTAG